MTETPQDLLPDEDFTLLTFEEDIFLIPFKQTTLTQFFVLNLFPPKHIQYCPLMIQSSDGKCAFLCFLC